MNKKVKSILKNTKAKEVNLKKEVSNNNRKSYFYVALELPPEILHIKGYRIVLENFIKVVYTENPIVVIA